MPARTAWRRSSTAGAARAARVFPVQAESGPSPSGEGLGRGILDRRGLTGPTPVPSPSGEGRIRLDLTRKNSQAIKR
ncbi:MAG: hypothetical protein E6R12_14175 [Sphingomonadales bacterium]|nr:MAG: hypothetical protein E6R12_14175 [Sphingomonadales bacterium]